MQWYLGQVKKLQASFQDFSLEQIPRSRNSHADSLATLATSLGRVLPRFIMVEDLKMLGWEDRAPIQVHSIYVGPS